MPWPGGLSNIEVGYPLFAGYGIVGRNDRESFDNLFGKWLYFSEYISRDKAQKEINQNIRN